MEGRKNLGSRRNRKGGRKLRREVLGRRARKKEREEGMARE